jgi:hypothetical protein
VIWFLARDPRTRGGLAVGIAIVLVLGAILFGFNPFLIAAIAIVLLLLAKRGRRNVR